MGFNLSLPPLVGLLLLAFLWLILLVLLVWFAFGRRRDLDEVAAKPRGRTRARRTERAGPDPKPGTSSRKPRTSDQQTSTRQTPARQTSVQRTPVQQTSAQPAPRPTVRAVTSVERPGDATGPKAGPKTDPKPDTKDAFDDFNQPDHRRDELDF